MSNNKFVNGLYTNDGSQYSPAYSFLKSPDTGLFKNNNGPLTVSVGGDIVTKFYNNFLEIVSGLRIPGGSPKAVLKSDEHGNASWSPSNSGTIKWNSIYKTINKQTDNNEIKIDFEQKLTDTPNVFTSKECDLPPDNFEIYIKNKTNESFTLYSHSYMFKNIISGEIGNYSITRLSNGIIAICYYNIEEDRIFYIRSLDIYGNKFAEPIIFDDVSAVGLLDMIIVGGKPAIVYIEDDATEDKFKYIRSLDVYGDKWETPINILTSTEDINFLPISLFIKTVDKFPTIFLNTQTGAAKMVRALDNEGKTWGSLINISNLVNHQILSVDIIDGNPAILAKSNNVNNIYYVRSLNAQGSSWPIGAAELYKEGQQSLFVNVGSRCSIMGLIDNNLCILASEMGTNDIYISKAIDAKGTSWGSFQYMINTNTSSPFLRIFENNNKTHLIYNDYTGSPSIKNLLTFSDIKTSNQVELTEGFMSLDLCQNHKVIKNVNDNNNLILAASDKKLSLLKFYGNDLKIGWFAQ